MTSALTNGSSPNTPESALYAVITETRRLFHRLTVLADDLHRDRDVTASQRAVLEELAGAGPQTVPGIARRKRVTRQHVQVLVNDLRRAGLVRMRDNPAHRRSQLVELTEEGSSCFDGIRQRERTILRRLGRRFQMEDLVVAAETLERLSESLDAAQGTPNEAPPANTQNTRR